METPRSATLESMDPDLKSIIYSYLPTESINVLAASTSFALSSQFTEIIQNRLYWKGRTELLVGYNLPQDGINWEKAYEDIKNSIDKGGSRLANVINTGNISAVSILLNIGDDPSEYDNEAIINAVKLGNTEIVRLLLSDPRVDPSARNNQAIINAKNTSIIRLLLNDKKVDPSAQNNKALINAVKTKNKYAAKFLLKDERVDPSAQNNESLIAAVKNNDLDFVNDLLKYPIVNPSDQENEATKIAVQDEYIDILELLLKDSRINLINDISVIMVIAGVMAKPNIVDILLRNKQIYEFVHDNISMYDEYPIIRERLEVLEQEDSFKGLVAAYYNYVGGEFGKLNNVYAAENIYSEFGVNLLLKREPLIKKIYELEYMLSKYETGKKAIHDAVISVLNMSVSKNTKDPMYYGFKGFLLLAYKPEYTMWEIRKILIDDGSTYRGLSMAAKLIGSQKGFHKLQEEGFLDTLALQENVKYAMTRTTISLS
jgi:hypothetical protein